MLNFGMVSVFLISACMRAQSAAAPRLGSQSLGRASSFAFATRSAVHKSYSSAFSSGSRRLAASVCTQAKKDAGGKKKSGWKGNKSSLPQKDCVVCGRPFSWRKKWERCWDEVKYCSDKCRRSGKSVRASSETCK
mmetsp:Transcript_16797/g.23531  ORF Transcript_16797/g.23531 Transcript_16797/m.23531 type:complete len:135 (-) Transcript_16797:47-451(-)